MLTAIGLLPVLEGSGTVSKQEPPAGGTIVKGSTIKLKLEPTT